MDIRQYVVSDKQGYGCGIHHSVTSPAGRHKMFDNEYGVNFDSIFDCDTVAKGNGNWSNGEETWGL